MRFILLMQLVREITRLNKDPGVHGIIVQLPLQSDNPISQDKITNLVSPDKDVDGYVCLYVFASLFQVS